MEHEILRGKYVNTFPFERFSVNPDAFDAYKAEERRIHAQFKADLLEEFGLTNHPKADKIFDYVWQESHAFGHMQVYGKMADLAELFLG